MLNVTVTFVFTLENAPSDSMSNPTSLPPLMEGYGRKRKKRTSIETNIKLTLEKRFLDVSLSIDFALLSRLFTEENMMSTFALSSVKVVIVRILTI